MANTPVRRALRVVLKLDAVVSRQSQGLYKLIATGASWVQFCICDRGRHAAAHGHGGIGASSNLEVPSRVVLIAARSEIARRPKKLRADYVCSCPVERCRCRLPCGAATRWLWLNRSFAALARLRQHRRHKFTEVLDSRGRTVERVASTCNCANRSAASDQQAREELVVWNDEWRMDPDPLSFELRRPSYSLSATALLQFCTANGLHIMLNTCLRIAISSVGMPSTFLKNLLWRCVVRTNLVDLCNNHF